MPSAHEDSAAVYQHSSALQKLRQPHQGGQPLQVAFLDIDGTFSGTPSEQQALRDLLETRGFVVVLVTARTSETCITKEAREKSSAEIRQRPLANLVSYATGKLKPGYPEETPAFTGLRDPDAIIGTLGGELAVRQVTGGYAADESYLAQAGAAPNEWRSQVVETLHRLEQTRGVSFGSLNPNEVGEHYRQGKHGVYFPQYRIETCFESLHEQETFASALAEVQVQETTPAVIKQLTLTHENAFAATPPVYKTYIQPQGMKKVDGVNRVYRQLHVNLSPSAKIEVLIAGDSPADLEMGLYGAPKSQATFLIPGGAMLYQDLQSETLHNIRQQMTKRQNNDTITTGVYQFPNTSRQVILGDEAFPGTVGPQTLMAWLGQ
ncbi:MAG: hypothetical protein AAB538_03510 [Patescibacteria group bacterium]